MSESMKPRFAVDLSEIERQLAQAQGAPSQPASAGRSDPLAELARIVGQDDPFQTLLANDASPRPRNQAASFDDLFASRETHAQGSRSRQEAPTYDARGEPRGAEPAYAYQEAAQPHGHEAYGDPAYSQDHYDENADQYAESGYDQAPHGGYQHLEKRRSRKGIVALGAILGAVVIGAGGAFLLSGNSSAVTSGEPPLIKATNEPIKVQPQNPGGVEIPNQNKQIYERANPNGDTKVVNREEQPVDVKQVARMNAGASAEATGATASAPVAHAQQTTGGVMMNLGEPRKVRTVLIKPDGSAVRPEGGNARPAAAPPAMALPAAAQAAPAATNVASAAPALPKAAATTPMATTPAASAPKAAPAASIPASGSSPQRVASAQPVAVAPAAAPETTATGGFSVQLAVRGSENEAQSAFQQLQKKFSDLEGMSSMIRKAEVNGNTVYRVRVGPMPRDEASSLCSKLQGQGGQCFVAKN
jgi:SPOR domain